jgi:flagellar motility protein MotE (MotC chaperone)
MSDEKRKSKDNEISSLTPEETQALDAAPSKSPIKKIMVFGGIGLAVFAVGIGAFSYMLGVFSSPSAADPAASKATDSTAVASANKPMVEDTSDIDALEQKIFGQEKNPLNAGDMDDIVRMADTMPAVKASADSAAAVPAIDEKAQLDQQRADIEQQKKQLEQERVQVEQLIAKSSVMESSRITALARLYDGMKPAQVVPLIIKLTDDQAVLVLLKMKPANAARVLGELPPEAGGRLSARMITLTEEK